MEEHPCFKVFMEINYHNSRLEVLGGEALQVLEMMRSQGMPMEVHDPLFQIAVRASGLEVEKSQNQNKAKRCKWWNRGFCREREGCSYDHPKEDCPDHINGKCNTKTVTLSDKGNSAGMKTVMKDATEVQAVNIFIPIRK